MKYNESMENYLEAILIIGQTKPVVRSVDIANQLGFKKPSVTVAVRNMKEKGYIDVSREGYITLTEQGKDVAEGVYERHQFFRDWLTSIGVDEAVANEDACSIEHVISQETFQAIRKALKR